MTLAAATIQTPFAVTHEFLLRVLPPDPICYIAWVHEGRFRHSTFEGRVDQAASRARWLSEQGHDAYFALAGFKVAKVQKGDYLAASRTQDNVKSIRALILDIDNKHYGGLRESLTAFQEAYLASQMPGPSYIVNSGGGLHVYWLFEEAMAEPEHRRRGLLLANLFKSRGLVADYQCTKDSARVLRVPGTLNYKYSPPSEVALVIPFQGYVDPEVVDAALGTAEASNVIALDPAMRREIGEVDNSALRGAATGIAISHFAKIVEHCPTVAEAVATGGERDGYPLWKNLLHLAAFTEDGAEFIHRFSERHPGYSYETTVEKFEESVETRSARSAQVGPTSCQAFSEDSPACQACPHWGKIKTPFVLGAPTPLESAAGAPPPTFTRNGATYRIRQVQDEDDPGVWRDVEERIADFEMFDFAVARFGLINETVLTFMVREGKQLFRLSIPTPDIGDLRSPALVREMALRSIMLGKKDLEVFRSAFMAWITHLRTQNATTGANKLDTSGYGWCEEDGHLVDSFAYGGDVYTSSGEVVPGHPHDALAGVYRCAGTLEKWKAAAAAICEDPRIPMHLVLAASFAAPLMRYFPDTPSFTLSLVSSGSGYGKSTALRVAAAVWAEPVRSMRQLNDTTNALVRHMALARDMPAYWDDIRGERRVDGFLEVMFQLTQGREKERLTRSAQTSPGGVLRTILTAASNTSVMERVSDRDETSDATARRVLEFTLAPLSDKTMMQERRVVFQGVRENYGHAGKELARWLPQNTARIIAWRDQILNHLSAKISATNEDRFWVDACAAILTGALVAKDLGLVPFDIPAMGAFLVKRLKAGKAEIENATKLAVEDVLQGILFANSDMTIRCNNSGGQLRAGNTAGRKPRGREVVVPPLRKPVTVEISRDDLEVVITSQAIREYVRALGNKTQFTARGVGRLLDEEFPTTQERRTIARETPWSGAQAHARVIRFVHQKEFAKVWDTAADQS